MSFRKIALIVIALAIAGAIAIYFSISGSAVVRPGSLYIPTGSTWQEVLDSLGGEAPRMKSVPKFELIAKAMRYGDRIRSGHYTLKEGMSYREVVGMLRSGAQAPVRVTFNNIRTLPQLAGRMAQQLEADSSSFAMAMTQPETLSKYGFTAATMPAMFIPNTYEFYWNTSPERFVERMNSEYERFWNNGRKDKLSTLGLTPEQAVTLASIVYEETKMTDEMPRVAGVYINRLKTGMPLQADPTLKFALGDFGIRRILNRDKEVDSPYNTYKYSGLPPGPICIPSIAAVEAVVDYERHSYLYFCARPDYSGYHSFARTLAEHNANGRKYWNFLDSEGIKR